MSTLIIIDLAVTIVFFIVVLAAALIYSSVFVSLFRDAPFVPSSRKIADAMMELAEVKFGEKVTDLGSGYGTLLFAAVRHGAEAEGYELSRVLGVMTRMYGHLFYPHAKLKVHHKDLFGADLRKTNVVSCYLFSKVMERLKDKFEAELAPGSRVVSASFQIPGWHPIKTTRIIDRPIYLYEIGKT